MLKDKLKSKPGFSVIPAIDIKDGRCVRLRQGLASEQVVYSDNPVRTARHWEEQGAKHLHIVDLDGAFSGRPVHTELIREIVKAVSIPVQVGGGLRTEEHVRSLLDLGVARVILGTSACLDAENTAGMAAVFGKRLAVGIDARDGLVRIKGWTETAPVNFLDMAARVAGMGVRTLVYTNIALDGMLHGPDTAGVGAVCKKVDCDVIASGGISSASHVTELRELRAGNLIGAIVGKALYDGKVTLSELTEEK